MEYQFNSAKETGNFDQFEAFLKAEREETDNNFIASDTWSKDNVRNLRPYWPESLISEASDVLAG